MSTFSWRLAALFFVLFLFLSISMITVTLLVVFDIKNNIEVNASELLFVEVSNFICAGLIFLALLSSLVGTPIVMYYQSKNKKWLETGLKPSA